MAIITETGVKLPDIPAELLAQSPYAGVYEYLVDGKRCFVLGLASVPLCVAPESIMIELGVTEIGFPSCDYVATEIGFGAFDVCLEFDPGTDAWVETDKIPAIYPLIQDEEYTNYFAWSNHDLKYVAAMDMDTGTLTIGTEVAIPMTASDLKEIEYRISKRQAQAMADAARKMTGTSEPISMSAVEQAMFEVVPLQPALNEINEFMSSNESFSIALNIDDKTRVLEKIMVPDVMVDLIDTVVCPNLVEMPNQFLQAGGYYTATNLHPKYVYLPVVNKVTSSAFTAQARLEKVVAPKATYIDDAFGGSWMQDNLIEIPRDWFPEALKIGYQTFQYFESLVRADFQKVGQMTNLSFAYCTKFKYLVLRNTEAVCSRDCVAENIFRNTLLYKGKGAFIVPAALVEDYKTGTWADLLATGSQILAIEDYSVDGTLDGDIDWDRVDAYIATL